MKAFRLTIAALAVCAFPAFAMAEEAAPVIEKQVEGCPDPATAKDSTLPDKCKDRNNATTDAERKGDAAPDQGGNNQTGNMEEKKSDTDANAGDNNKSGSDTTAN